MSRTKYTRELLTPLVASSGSLSEVIRKLGLVPNGGMHRLISARVRQADLDTSHFRFKRINRAIADGVDALEEIVRSSRSIA
jgi:hypothetical protein